MSKESKQRIYDLLLFLFLDSNESLSLEDLNLEEEGNEGTMKVTKEFIEKSFKNLKSINKSFQSSSSSSSSSTNLPSFEIISKFYDQILKDSSLLDLLRIKIESILKRPGAKIPLENSNWMIILFEVSSIFFSFLI